MSETVEANFTVTVDDDAMVHKLIEKAMGIPSKNFSSGKELLEKSLEGKPSAIFVDVNLGQGSSSLDLIPTIRGNWPHCPIIVVTGDSQEDAIGQALAAGANDFVRKPINTKEILARVRVRSFEISERINREQISFGDLSVDLRLNRVSCDGKEQHLSSSDTQLLSFLMQSQGALVSRDEIRRYVWGDIKVSDNALDKKIFEVRQAMKNLNSKVKIESAYGRGMRLTLESPGSPAIENASIKRVLKHL